MARVLNRQDFIKADLDPECYLAMSGLVKEGIVEEIKHAMTKKFPGVIADDVMPEPMGGTVIYVYAYLQKVLPFAEAFDSLKEPLTFHAADGAVEVASFGMYEVRSLGDADEYGFWGRRSGCAARVCR